MTNFFFSESRFLRFSTVCMAKNRDHSFILISWIFREIKNITYTSVKFFIQREKKKRKNEKYFVKTVHSLICLVLNQLISCNFSKEMISTICFSIHIVMDDGQELFYKFVSNLTNKLVIQLLSMTVYADFTEFLQKFHDHNSVPVVLTENLHVIWRKTKEERRKKMCAIWRKIEKWISVL